MNAKFSPLESTMICLDLSEYSKGGGISYGSNKYKYSYI